MARKPREFGPGAITHLTACGVDDQPILHTVLDAVALLAGLREMTRRIGWQVITWCFMTTHYHLLVALGRDVRVARAMQTLNSTYAREFNVRHGRKGHVFGARYTDTPVATEGHLQAAAAYILDNPVRAGLVRRAEDWSWSGDGSLTPRLPLHLPEPRGSRPAVRRPPPSG